LYQLDRTIILYESPHRLIKTINQLAEVFPDNMLMVICRELTKLHEEVVRGTPGQVLTHFNDTSIKGELVIVFNKDIVF
jgi:16S rRNA (cytidine1402-2'-O)-methyltransferase